MRRTKSAAIALERMRAVLNCEAPANRRWAIRKLAFLADQARRQKRDDVRQLVRFTGRDYGRGLKGWEAEALSWLRIDA